MLNSQVVNRYKCACYDMAYYVTGKVNAGGEGCAQVYVPLSGNN